MWKTLNSPLVITLIILATLFSYDQIRKQTVAGEIRGVYNELLAIGEDAKSDLEKKKLVEGIVKEAARQFKMGFNSFGDDSKKTERAEKNRDYFQTKSRIEITPPKIVENKKYSKIQKTIMYEVKNNSKAYLSKVAHTIALYNKKELVEVKEEWGNIKLAPGDSKPYSYTISNQALVFDNVSISVNDIVIMEVAQ